jgi:formamidopyrimidine-DNA glycosylase
MTLPELPEVETVRAGLERWMVGRTIADVDVLGARTLRRHVLGPADFVARVRGRRVMAARRRGKYLWLPLDSGDAVIAHLGMSGQFLAVAPGTEDGPHLRARFVFADGPPEIRFLDQRTFGGLALDETTGPGAVPAVIAHIALDPLDPAFDRGAFHAALRRRRTGLKRALLDQTLVSGVGNIYADEALWRAKVNGARIASTLSRRQLTAVLDAAADVMLDALAKGGTSFDSLYVNVNGESGYFDRSLDAYGREGEPCRRCGAVIRREKFMNRSSFYCPKCQPRPRVSSVR